MKHTTYVGIIVLVVVGFCVPQISFASYRDSSTFKNKIKKLDNKAVEEMPIPVLLGVEQINLIDTYSDARSGGRTHNAIDIFAARGSLVASPTEAVVTKITPDTGFGGIQVWTANPGGEEYYFAHLNAVYPRLEEGDVLEPGDLIGFVGNTGNAINASPHLHFAIYTKDRENPNPYNRLKESFELKTRINSLIDYIEYLQELLKKLEKQ